MTIAWDKLELRLALVYMVIVLVVLYLASVSDAAWIAAGLGALIAWLSVLLGAPGSRFAEIAGLWVFLVFGAVLTGIAHFLLVHEIMLIFFLGAIAFVCTLPIAIGLHWFVVGWCLIFWFVLSPTLSNQLGFADTLTGFAIGAAAVLLYSYCKRFWTVTGAYSGSVPEPLLDTNSAVRYAVVVSLTMIVALALGWKALPSDHTIVAVAALNVISPTADATWRGAASRVVFGIGGIVLGFWLAVLLPQPIVFQLVLAICSFVAIAFIRVDFGPVVGAFAVITAYSWGLQDGVGGNMLANEKIIGELVGVVLAGLAIVALNRLYRRPKTA